MNRTTSNQHYYRIAYQFSQFGGKIRKNERKKTTSENNLFNENVSEPWFSLISLGLKVVEGRKNKGRFKDMKVGDVIEWTNNDFFPRKVLTRIIGKATYKTFHEYLKTEGLDKCLPGVHTIQEGENIYYKYYTKEDEREFGVVAIRLERL